MLGLATKRFLQESPYSTWCNTIFKCWPFFWHPEGTTAWHSIKHCFGVISVKIPLFHPCCAEPAKPAGVAVEPFEIHGFLPSVPRLRSDVIAVLPSSEATPTSCVFAFSLGNPRGTVNPRVFVHVFYTDIVSGFLLQRKTIGCVLCWQAPFLMYTIAIILGTTHEGFGSQSC